MESKSSTQNDWVKGKGGIIFGTRQIMNGIEKRVHRSENYLPGSPLSQFFQSSKVTEAIDFFVEFNSLLFDGFFPRFVFFFVFLRDFNRIFTLFQLFLDFRF